MELGRTARQQSVAPTHQCIWRSKDTRGACDCECHSFITPAKATLMSKDLRKVITVIKNETAGVDGTSTEILDVEVECLHDARREKNRGARCSQTAGVIKIAVKILKESSSRPEKESVGAVPVRLPGFFLGSAGAPAWRGMNTPVPAHSRLAPGGVRKRARMPAAGDAGGCGCDFLSGGHADALRTCDAGAPYPAAAPARWDPATLVPHAAAVATASSRSRRCLRSCCCFRALNCRNKTAPRKTASETKTSGRACASPQSTAEELTRAIWIRRCSIELLIGWEWLAPAWFGASVGAESFFAGGAMTGSPWLAAAFVGTGMLVVRKRATWPAASLSRSQGSAGACSSGDDGGELTCDATPLGLSSPEACRPHRIDCGEPASTSACHATHTRGKGKRSELREIRSRKLPNMAPQQKRQPTNQTNLCRGTVSSTLPVADDEPSHAAREAVHPFLLVALALGRDRRLLLLREEVIIQELVGKPELRAASGWALLRHSAKEGHATLHAWTERDGHEPE